MSYTKRAKRPFRMGHRKPPTERQLAPELVGIRQDHVERYKFACQFVHGQIIDAACGCGYGSHMLATQADKPIDSVLGLDISEEAIEYAKTHWGAPNLIFRQEDLSNSIEPGDWLVSFETLEHLDDPLDVLFGFFACEHAIVSVPNSREVPFDREQFPFHKKHYTKEELRDMMATAGFGSLQFFGQKDTTSRVGEYTDDCRTIICVSY